MGVSGGSAESYIVGGHLSRSNHPIVRRAPQIFYGSAFPNNKGRVWEGCELRGALVQVYQGASDFFLGPTEDLKAIEGLDLDFEVELAVIIDAVPLGVSVVDAGNYIKVLTACNDFTYRKLAASDRKSGFGFVQSKALTSFCAFGLLPSTSTEMWNGGRPILGARVTLNGEIFCEISTLDMLSSFPEIVAYCAKTRDLPAGTVITSGAISTNGQGDSCIAEKKYRLRMNCETCNVDFLQVEDVVKIEFFSLDRAGKFQSDSLFGPLENRVITR